MVRVLPALQLVQVLLMQFLDISFVLFLQVQYLFVQSRYFLQTVHLREVLARSERYFWGFRL